MADAPAGQRPILVFIHVPKTAGTTIRGILWTNEEPGLLRRQRLGNVFKGGGGISTKAIESLLDGTRTPDLGDVRVLRGHFPLGIREILPTFLTSDREFRYFTFLRDPVERILSHFYMMKEPSPDPERPARLSPDVSLDEALEEGHVHDNLQTRMLSGILEPFGEVTEEMLEMAKHNLREEFSFFGLAERFDESLVIAKHRLGLGNILYRLDRRVNASRPRGDDVPRDIAIAAQRSNFYDIELYRYAQELFEAQPELQELEFDANLAALRAAKVEGEIDASAPPSPRFSGGDDEWRMLIQAKALLLRHERDIAEIKTRVYELRKPVEEVLEQLRSIDGNGAGTDGADGRLRASQPARRQRKPRKADAAGASPSKGGGTP